MSAPESTSMMRASHWLAWVILAIIALSYIVFIAQARGPEHHRGDEVGTHGTRIVVIQRAP